jgi:5,10-methylenetetrahydrofolate reductase
VDLLILETFADLLEIEQAIRAARAVCDLPVIASMSFNREGRTLTGATPESAARRLIDLNVDVLGANCSTGPRGVQEVVARYRAVLTELGLNTPISAMPNAGYPETRGERLFYPASAEYFGQYAQRLIEAGASIVGGCCGTTPEHVAAMRRTVDAMDGAARTTAVVSARPVASEPAATAAPIESALATALRNRTFITTVELEPPKSADTTELEANARMLRDAGATVLDVSDMPMARMRMAGMAAALKVQMAAGIETVLHFPVRGRNLLRVQGDLLAAHALGVRNLFVTMGDPAAIGDYPQAFDNHDIVPTGLVQLIKSQFNAGQDSAGTSIGEACRFVVGVAANLTPGDLDKEARLLKKKIECGADFALTQPVFDAAHARRWAASRSQCHADRSAQSGAAVRRRHRRDLPAPAPAGVCSSRCRRADKTSGGNRRRRAAGAWSRRQHSFVPQQPDFGRQPAAVAGERAVRSDDAVAWNQNADRVAPVGLPNCPRCLRLPDDRRNPAIRLSLAIWTRRDLGQHPALKLAAAVERRRHVEHAPPTGKILGQLRTRMFEQLTGCFCH